MRVELGPGNDVYVCVNEHEQKRNYPVSCGDSQHFSRPTPVLSGLLLCQAGGPARCTCGFTARLGCLSEGASQLHGMILAGWEEGKTSSLPTLPPLS